MDNQYLKFDETKKHATREAFGETLLKLLEEGKEVVAVDADLTGSTTLKKLKSDHAERLINVGIAEQNMIDVAAGLSLDGFVAYTGSFAVFGTGRCYDQIRNTVCYSNLNVKICPTHAGISVGPDGGSHQMLEDVALMSVLPRMRVLVPGDFNSCKQALRLAYETPGPVYVRQGRAKLPQVYSDDVELKLGGSFKLRDGEDVTIIANGVEVAESLKAASALAEQGVSCDVIDAYCSKPIDKQTILESAKKTGKVIVCEEHSIYGGLCSSVAMFLSNMCPCKMGFVAVKNKFGTSGEFEELLSEFELDDKAIVRAVQEIL